MTEEKKERDNNKFSHRKIEKKYFSFLTKYKFCLRKGKNLS